MSEKVLTTLCYIEKDNSYLMMHRIKKKDDINKDKYIGVGGHIEHNESPEECVIREIKEETGLSPKKIKLRGLLTFVIDDYDEYSFLYTCDEFTGELKDCDEGELIWIDKDKVNDLPIWEGDKVFFKLLNETDSYFSLKLVYSHDELVEVCLNGKPLDIYQYEK